MDRSKEKRFVSIQQILFTSISQDSAVQKETTNEDFGVGLTIKKLDVLNLTFNAIYLGGNIYRYLPFHPTHGGMYVIFYTSKSLGKGNRS